MGKSAIGTGLARLAVLVEVPARHRQSAGRGAGQRGVFELRRQQQRSVMTNFPEKIASALMESIMAAFRTETADLQRLADEVDAAGQDVEKIRAAIERHGNRRTQAMETIRTMLTAEVAEFNASWALGKPGSRRVASTRERSLIAVSAACALRRARCVQTQTSPPLLVAN